MQDIIIKYEEKTSSDTCDSTEECWEHHGQNMWTTSNLLEKCQQKYTYTWYHEDTVEISGMHNEERRHEEFDTHKTGWRHEGVNSVTYLTTLCKWITKQKAY